MENFNAPFGSPDANSHQFSSRKKEILLLVEDDLVNQMLGRKMLAKAGFDIDVASDGHIALEMLKKKVYDVVITDIKLPSMSGLELADKIRKSTEGNFAGIPIIAVSAFPANVEQEKALKAGINQFISKPFSFTELVDAINSKLRK